MKHRTFLSKVLLITVKTKQDKPEEYDGQELTVAKPDNTNKPPMTVHITDGKGNIIRRISGIAALM